MKIDTFSGLFLTYLLLVCFHFDKSIKISRFFRFRLTKIGGYGRVLGLFLPYAFDNCSICCIELTEQNCQKFCQNLTVNQPSFCNFLLVDVFSQSHNCGFMRLSKLISSIENPNRSINLVDEGIDWLTAKTCPNDFHMQLIFYIFQYIQLLIPVLFVVTS